MIKRLSAKNFQGLSKIDLKFSPRVTTIVGPTDVGKSSVLRALSFVALNKPSGIGIIKDFTKSCEALLETNKGTVTRKRSKSSNTYLIGKQVYKAFGSSPPDDVLKLLNLDQINFQKQLDLPFWFTESAGQVSKNLNAIVNLELIDSSLAYTASELKSARADFEEADQKYKTAKADKKLLAFVPALREDVESYDKAKTRLEKTRSKIVRLRSLVAPASIHTRTQENVLNATLDAEKALCVGRTAKRLSKQTAALRSLLKEVRRVKVDALLDVPDISTLQSVRTKGDKAAERRRNLELLLDEITPLEEDLCHLERQLAKAEKTLKKSKPKTCPKCGQPIKRSSASNSATYTSLPSHPSLGGKRKRNGSPCKHSTSSELVPW